MIATLFSIGITVVSILILAQSAHTLYLALYAWNRPPSDSQAPDAFKPDHIVRTGTVEEGPHGCGDEAAARLLAHHQHA